MNCRAMNSARVSIRFLKCFDCTLQELPWRSLRVHAKLSISSFKTTIILTKIYKSFLKPFKQLHSTIVPTKVFVSSKSILQISQKNHFKKSDVSTKKKGIRKSTTILKNINKNMFSKLSTNF